MPPFGVTIPATVPQRSEILEGLMNYPAVAADRYQKDETACLAVIVVSNEMTSTVYA
jgi:hypothetical protein